MKRLPLLMLALVVLGGCGQSNEPAATASTTTAAQEPAATAAPATSTPAQATTTQAPAGTNLAAAPAADSEGADTIQLAQADFSAVEAAGFVEGTHYRRLSPTQATSTSPNRVEVNEFFMHTCIHCFNLEPYVEAWLPNKPDFIDFVPVPTTWDPTRKFHAQAYYAAVALGKAEEMQMPFFREMHERGNYLQ